MSASEKAMTEREAIRYLALKRAQLERRYGPRRARDTNIYIHALDVAIGALAASVMILEGTSSTASGPPSPEGKARERRG